MSSDRIATQGDIRYHNNQLSGEINSVKNEVYNIYNDMSSQMQYMQEKTSSQINNISKDLEGYNKKFDELQKKLNNPLANQANELRTRAIESFNNGWLKESKDEIQKALELNNKDFISHIVLARIYKKENNIDKSIEHYDLALKYSEPYDNEFWKSAGREKSELYLEIARNFLKEDKLLDAIKYYDLSLKDLLKFDVNLYQLISAEKALTYYNYGNIEEAIKELNRTINKIGINYILPDIYYLKANFLIEKGENEEAFNAIITYLNKTLKIDQVLNDSTFEPIKEKVQEWYNKEIEPKIKELEEIEKEVKNKYSELFEILREIERETPNEEKNKLERFVIKWEELKAKYDNVLNLNISSIETLNYALNQIKEINNSLEEIKNEVIEYVKKFKLNPFSLVIITWKWNFMALLMVFTLNLLIDIIFHLIDWIFHLKLTNLMDSQWWLILIMIMIFSLSFVGVLEETDNYREIKIKLNLINKKKYYISLGLFTIIATSVFLIIFNYIISFL